MPGGAGYDVITYFKIKITTFFVITCTVFQGVVGLLDIKCDDGAVPQLNGTPIDWKVTHWGTSMFTMLQLGDCNRHQLVRSKQQ